MVHHCCSCTLRSEEGLTVCAAHLQCAHVLQPTAVRKVPQQEGRHVQPAVAGVESNFYQMSQPTQVSMQHTGAQGAGWVQLWRVTGEIQAHTCALLPALKKT